MAIYPIIIAGIIAVDQLTKILVRSNIALGERIPVLGDWLTFTYIKNEGAAFSMFSGNQLVTLVLTSALIIFCTVYLVKEVKSGNKKFAICLACIIGGGVSNLIDRFFFGFVTDMISCGSFAIFNVADMFVTCGCILAIVYILFFDKDRKESADE